MISASGDDFDARVTALEQYLDELDRRTRSNVAVTNPTTGVKNLEVGPVGADYQVRLRDSDGNVIYGNHPDAGVVGFRMPMPMYPSIPYASRLFATTSTFIDQWQMKTFVNSKALLIQYRYGETVHSGGTSEVRVQYDIGAGRVTMPGSTTSSVNPTNTTYAFNFTWPSDVFNVEVQLFLQARMASGTGSLSASPMYVLGG